MKITTVLLMACISWATVACVAQDSYSREYRNALRDGAKAKITVSASAPGIGSVSNATVNVFFEQSDGNQYMKEGKTDISGMFTVEGLTRSSIGGSVMKDGFYRSVFRLPFATGQERIADGRWLPWNPTIPVVLREVRNPIPMYVKRAHGKFPNGETAGFDCEKGDFVAPHGNGETVDFRVALAVDGVPYKHMTQTIALDALDPDGGFQSMKSHPMSVFKSEHLAPEVGYVSNLVATSVYDVNRGTTGSVLYGGDEYLVFKSRIIRDEHGNVVSANYGKIYGAIVFGRGDDKMETASIGFLYYFNPTPNDRNLEFDGKNNLFKPDWRSNLNWSRDP